MQSCKIENIAYVEINEQSFSNPHTLQNRFRLHEARGSDSLGTNENGNWSRWR